jgi:hypothetical protein
MTSSHDLSAAAMALSFAGLFPPALENLKRGWIVASCFCQTPALNAKRQSLMNNQKHSPFESDLRRRKRRLLGAPRRRAAGHKKDRFLHRLVKNAGVQRPQLALISACASCILAWELSDEARRRKIGRLRNRLKEPRLPPGVRFWED